MVLRRWNFGDCQNRDIRHLTKQMFAVCLCMCYNLLKEPHERKFDEKCENRDDSDGHT